ncbi:cytochrome c family protein [Phenylobacterium sp.]|uniref:c-type cytochrome n=1 Tax=Phenylobacterium sp. TaxID=1871053 RepID=UPI0035B205F7
MVRLLTAPLAAGAALALLCTAGAAFAGAPGNAAHGKAVFAAQCSMCHSAAPNGAGMMGPPLFGVVGRKAATAAGFPYSPAMRAQTFTWTDERLHAYLPAPARMVPGTRMAMYPGLHDPRQLDDVIAYLDSLK